MHKKIMKQKIEENKKKSTDISTLSRGFTLVELLIVIVVVAILATITVVSYSGVQDRAREAVAKANLSQSAKQLNIDKIMKGRFPSTVNADGSGDANGGKGLIASSGTTFEYTVDNTAGAFCLSLFSGSKAYHITNTGTPQDSSCPGHSGSVGGNPGGGNPGGGDPGGGNPGGPIANGSRIQTITSANCPTTRTRAVDARDNRSYWVQKLSDGKCWMLTNLAYAGGGTNTYGDVKTLTNGGGSWTIFESPRYYIPPGANPTNEPTNPSTSTNGTGQYGYLYNWCGALGGQPGAACGSVLTPVPNPSISVCPSGWRLPTSGINGGEFAALNNAVNGGSTNNDSGLRTNWLAQRAGIWNDDGFSEAGLVGSYWSSTHYAQSGNHAYVTYFASNEVMVDDSYYKFMGFSVRCVSN